MHKSLTIAALALTLLWAAAQTQPAGSAAHAGELLNLVGNPSVEATTIGYAPINSSIARSTHGAQSAGQFGLAVTTEDADDAGVNYGGPRLLPASPGTTYTFSAQARLRDPGEKHLEAIIVFHSPSGSLLAYQETRFVLDQTAYGPRYAVTATAPPETASAVVALQTKFPDGVFVFFTDAWQVEIGSQPSPYTDDDQGDRGCALAIPLRST